MRVVEDHHVDRPGVEAQQCVELTGTNSSIGLIALIKQCPLEAVLPSRVARRQDQNSDVIAQHGHLARAEVTDRLLGDRISAP